jgi:hypothetical protein
VVFVILEERDGDVPRADAVNGLSPPEGSAGTPRCAGREEGVEGIQPIEKVYMTCALFCVLARKLREGLALKNHRIGFGMLHGHSYPPIKSRWGQDVIRVEEHDERTAGGGEALVPRDCSAAFGASSPQRTNAGIGSGKVEENGPGVIAGKIIDDDGFPSWIDLALHGRKRLEYEAASILRRDYDRY